MKVGDIIIDYKFKSGVETKVIYKGEYYKRIGIVCSDYTRETLTKWCLYHDHFEGWKSRNLVDKYLIHLERPSSANLRIVLNIFDKIFEDSKTPIYKPFNWSPFRISSSQLINKLKERYLEYKQLERQYKLKRIINENMLG